MMIVNDVHFEGGINFERNQPHNAKLRQKSSQAVPLKWKTAGLFAAPCGMEIIQQCRKPHRKIPAYRNAAKGFKAIAFYQDGVPIYDDSVPAIEWEDIVQQDAAISVPRSGIATFPVSFNGFDVSHNQGSIVARDAVKNSGIDFVMIRCGIGSEYDGVGENKQDDAHGYSQKTSANVSMAKACGDQ